MSEELIELRQRVGGTLDTDARAWIVGVGLLSELTNPPPVSIHRVLEHAASRAQFPSGPFAVAPGVVEVEMSADGLRAGATTGTRGQPVFEGRIELHGPALSVALTRSGVLDDGAVEPSHVMLSDVEAVLVDLVELMEAYASECAYAGPTRVHVGIESAVPDRPVELRVYDELCGDNLRPAAGYSHFTPIDFGYPGRLDPDAAEQVRWDSAVRAAHQFGVFVPQLVGQARAVTAVSYLHQPHAS